MLFRSRALQSGREPQGRRGAVRLRRHLHDPAVQTVLGPAHPLGRALQDYADSSNQELLRLLLPVQRAAEQCAWLKAMVDSGEIFHPLRWTPQDAFALLRDAAILETAGIVLRMPARWRAGRPARAQVRATLSHRGARAV